MKILLIAYAFPPLLEAQSIRWAYISKELIQKGVSVDVFTIKLPKGYGDPDCLPHPQIKIYPTFPGPIEGMFFIFKKDFLKDGLNVRENTKRKGIFIIGKHFYKLTRNTLNNVLIPDIRTEWFPFAFIKLREILNKNSYDIIVSSHEPGVCHLLGLCAKKLKNIIWIGDFGDPFVTIYTPRYRRPIDKTLERILLQNMDHILLTNNCFKEIYCKKYKLSANKITIIPQGFNTSEKLSYIKNNTFTIIYTGTFYKKFRSPKNLIKALQILKDKIPFKFILAGRNEQFLKDFQTLGESFEFLGLISHKETLIQQAKADLLINIANDQPEQIPGKGYEYLGSKRPILYISNFDDEYAQLIKRINRGLVVKNDAIALVKALSKIYDLWYHDELDQAFYLGIDRCKEFSWLHITEKFLNLLNQLK